MFVFSTTEARWIITDRSVVQEKQDWQHLIDLLISYSQSYRFPFYSSFCIFLKVRGKKKCKLHNIGQRPQVLLTVGLQRCKSSSDNCTGWDWSLRIRLARLVNFCGVTGSVLWEANELRTCNSWGIFASLEPWIRCNGANGLKSL